jgi:hypothetical protein
MTGAFDEGGDGGAFQGEPPDLPNPFPGRFSDAGWQWALQRYDDRQRLAALLGSAFGLPSPGTAAMAAAPDGNQAAPPATTGTNPLDLWGIGGDPSAARNALDIYGISSPDAAWQAWARTYGPRVQDVGGDVARFTQNLQLDNRNVVGPTVGGDYRGA